MSEALEAQQKTNPQGDPITSVAAPKADGKKDPHFDAKRQKVVTPEYMFHEAPRTKEFITGSEAAKEAIRRSNVDLAVAYPITPQSETMQLVGVLYGEGYVKEYYRGEEEVGVMADGRPRNPARHGRDCVLAWSPVARCRDVHLPCRQRPVGYSTRQHRSGLLTELRHDRVPC
jgi:hypothetical protein